MKLYLYIANEEDYLNGCYDYAFTLYAKKHDWNERIFVQDVEVNIANIDRTEITQKVVDTISKEEEKTRAEFEIKMGMLEEKKQNLLSITHQPLSVA